MPQIVLTSVFFPLQTLAPFFYGFCQIDELRVWKGEKDIVDDGSTTGWACRHLQLSVSVCASVSVLTVGTAGRNKLLICPEAMPQISVFNTCVCGANKWNSFRLHCDDHRKTNGRRVAAVASNCQLPTGRGSVSASLKDLSSGHVRA